MSWVTIIWSMTAGASLMLAAEYFAVWRSNDAEPAYGWFALTATCTAALALIELALMRADTPAAMGTIIRWGQVVVWALLVSLVAFVHLRLNADSWWALSSAIGARTVATVVNFSVGENLNFLEVSARRETRVFGETVYTAQGAPNPWMAFGQLSLLLIVVSLMLSARAAWRRGSRRQAVLVGGCSAAFVAASGVSAAISFLSNANWPFVASPFYLGILVVMNHELSGEVLRASQLTGRLRESEQRMTLAAEAANLGIWTAELPKGEVWATDRLRSLWGFGATEALSLETLVERVHPDDRVRVRETLTRNPSDAGTFDIEHRLRFVDDTVRWLTTHGRVELDEPGQPGHVRAVSLDITPRIQAEAEARAHRDEVSHLTRVATLGELSAGLAHELTQPLAGILSNAQAARRFLAQGPEHLADIPAILDDIVADDRRATEVIRRIRRLLKKSEYRPEPLDVNALTRDTLALLRPQLAAREVTLSLHLDSALPAVCADPIQLQQVLLNLILNAGEAMADVPVGARTLTLRTEASGGSNVLVSVADTGRGLSPGREEKAFEPFFSTKPHGLGLGLPLSRSIIEAHGGRLWAENQRAGGVVFRVMLPRAEEHEP